MTVIITQLDYMVEWMPVKWILIKDDKSHWHYELAEDRSDWCCEFMDQQKICLDCEDQPRWHVSFQCPICRGPGEEFKSNEY